MFEDSGRLTTQMFGGTDEELEHRLAQEPNASGRRRRSPPPTYVPASLRLYGPNATAGEPSGASLRSCRKGGGAAKRVADGRASRPPGAIDVKSAKKRVRPTEAAARRTKGKKAGTIVQHSGRPDDDNAMKVAVKDEHPAWKRLMEAAVKEEGDATTDDGDADGEDEEDTNEPADPNTPPQLRSRPTSRTQQRRQRDDMPRRELPPPEGFPAGTLVWAKVCSGNKCGSGGVWWPGRVWKLRNCLKKKALWRLRGAAAEPRALVQCFGDGTFVWCAADELVPYTGDAHARQRRAAELISLTSSSGSRTKKRTGGVKMNTTKVNKALLEAEEAELMHWDSPWSDSDSDDNDTGGGGGVRHCSDGNVAADDERPIADAFAMPGGANTGVKAGARAEAGASDSPAVDERIKDGLTPDWVIDAGCRIFGLNVSTVDQPIITGLLDPCTNNRRSPNIPAEKTYDKQQDGLKQENPWRGYHVILNPSYESQVQ